MKRFLLFLLLGIRIASGAFTEFYVQPTGSNLNAGYKATDDTGAIDDAATYTYAGGTFVRSTGVFTVASGNPTSDGVDVDDFASVYTTSGATTATLVARITARSSTTITVSTTAIHGTAATVSESAAAATLKIGGAWSGPATTVSFPWGFVLNTGTNTAAEQVCVNFKGGTAYSITAAMTHANPDIRFEGYTTTAHDGGMAEFDGGDPATSFVMLTLSGANCTLAHFLWDANGQSTAADSMVNATGAHAFIYRNRFFDAARCGIDLNSSGFLMMECDADACNTTDSSDRGGFRIIEEGTLVRCRSHDHSGASACGYVFGNSNGEPVTMIECTSENTGGDCIATSGSTVNLRAVRCNFIGAVDDGADLRSLNSTNSLLVFESCNFVNNTGWACNHDTLGVTYPFFFTCGFYNNTSGKRTTNFFNPSFVIGDVDYSASPFTDAANGDVSLTSASGAGAAARGAGRALFLPSSYSGSTLSYPDIGAAQHADAVGSGARSRSFRK